MITDEYQTATRRTAERPQWRGQVPLQLLARLEAEPVIGDGLCGLGDALLAGLDGRLLELVALRVSAVRDCLYVWRGHCAIAIGRPVGALAADEIARLAAGPAALIGEDAAVVQAVDELLARSELAAATRRRIGARALGIVVATRFYDTVATIMRDAESDAAPLDGLETPELAAQGIGW